MLNTSSETLEIQAKKKGIQAVLLGQDFHQSFGSAPGLFMLCWKVHYIDFMKGWVSPPENQALLRFLSECEASENTGATCVR